MSQSLAFVFPGQGSQQIGMLAELAQDFPVIEQTFKEASDVLGYDLWDVAQQGPAEKLNSTDVTQPALLAASVALWRVWQQQEGAAPSVLAGHSLGEYSALVCAGAIKFADGIRLVQLRGQFMQSAVPEGVGAMAAILGLDDAAVKQVCETAANGRVVSPVNYNCPGQVVIAGEKAAVEDASAQAKEAGAKRVVPLAVSVPSHCALMKPAAEQLAAELDRIEISMPIIKVIHNVNAEAAGDVAELKAHLVEQLYSPVLWTDCVKRMQSLGAETLVECGPGKVLSGLNKKVDRALDVASIGDQAGLEKALAQ